MIRGIRDGRFGANFSLRAVAIALLSLSATRVFAFPTATGTQERTSRRPRHQAKEEPPRTWPWPASLLCARVSQETPTFGTTVVISSGLRGQIYKIRHWTSHLPDLSHKKPIGIIYTASLNVPPQKFDQGFPGLTDRFEWFAIDYQGRFWIPSEGIYRWKLTSDDGANLYLDDQLVIDNDGAHPPRTRTGDARLAPGLHQIRVTYFQGPRFEVALVLEVAPPGEPEFRIFNLDDFKPPPDAAIWSDQKHPSRPIPQPSPRLP